MINKRSSNVLFWIAILFFFLAIIFIVFWMGTAGFLKMTIPPHFFGSQFDFACLGFTISIALVLVVYYLVRKKFDFFEFPVWFTLNIYFQVIINVWLFQRDYSFYSPWLQAGQGEAATRTILLFWAGLAIIWGAYFLRIRLFNYKSKPLYIDDGRPRIRIIFAAWFLTWLINIFLVLTGAQGYLNSQTSFVGGNYVFFLNLINDLATFTLLLYVFKKPTKWGIAWILLVCFSEIIIGLIIGTRGAAYLFLYIAICFYYVRGRLPASWLIAGLLILIALVPITSAFRSNLYISGFSRRYGASFSNRILVLGRTITESLNQPISEFGKQTRNLYEVRQAGLFQVSAAILKVHPSIKPFIFYDLVRQIGTSIIPRFLWPEKPVAIPEFLKISSNYLGAQDESSFETPGMISDAYRVGGYVFLVLWLGAITYFFKWLYQRGPGSKRLSWTGLYLVFITGIITYDSDIYSTIMRMLQFGILLFLLNRFVFFQYGKKSDQIGV